MIIFMNVIISTRVAQNHIQIQAMLTKYRSSDEILSIGVVVKISKII